MGPQAWDYTAPELTMELAWDGDPRDLNLLLTVRNVGTVPARVDRELVFLVDLYIATPEDEPAQLEDVRTLPPASSREIKKRICSLRPGGLLQRRVALRDGFKRFTCAWGFSGPAEAARGRPSYYCASSEVISRVPDGVTIGSVDAFYARPGWDAPSFMMEGGWDYRPQPPPALGYGLPTDLYGGPFAAGEALRALPAAASEPTPGG